MWEDTRKYVRLAVADEYYRIKREYYFPSKMDFCLPLLISNTRWNFLPLYDTCFMSYSFLSIPRQPFSLFAIIVPCFFLKKKVEDANSEQERAARDRAFDNRRASNEEILAEYWRCLKTSLKLAVRDAFIKRGDAHDNRQISHSMDHYLNERPL